MAVRVCRQIASFGLAFLLVAAGLWITASLYAQAPAPAASFAFSETSGTSAADESGNVNHGTLVNGGSWSTGRYSNGLTLDGADDYVEVGTSDPIQLTTAFTFTSWLYPTGSARHTLFHKEGSGGYSFEVGVDGRPHLTGSFGGQAVDVYAHVSVPQDAWTHLAATYDGSAVRIYIDGVQRGMAAASGSVIVSSQPLLVGGTLSGRAVNGTFDEVRLYSSALTAAQVGVDMITPVDATTSFQVAHYTPSANALGILTTGITAAFTKGVNVGTLTTTTFELRDDASTLVSATVSYDSASRRATLTPVAALDPLSEYTATVVGGSGGVLDGNGVALAGDIVWTFTTAETSTFPSAHYAFSETSGLTTEDGSANGNTGTLLNGTTRAVGQVGNGLTLDGIDDLVRVPSSDTLDLSAAFTLEGWIRPTTAAWHTIIRRNGSYSLQISNSGLAEMVGSFGGNAVTARSTVSVPVNAWSHVAVTYDGSTVRLYVDAVEVDAESATGSLPFTIEPLLIGGDVEPGLSASGQLDEVRIYRRALSQAEIAADMLDGDDSAPTVIAVTPLSGSTNASPTTNVIVAFSEPMDVATLTSATLELRDGANVLVASSVSYDPNTHTATLAPASTLAELASYAVYVRGGGVAPVVTDLAGNALASTASWSFATADVTPPTMSSTLPTNNQRNVALGLAVQATFSEPIDVSTLTTGTFQVRDTRNLAVAGAVTYDAPTRTATFTPTTALLPTRSYAVTLSGGASGSRIQDVAGNALAANVTWSFITTVESTRIAAGGYHSLALDDAGQVWAWGSDAYGQRGNDLDARLPGIVTAATSIVSIAAGRFHSLALKSDGTLVSWGQNWDGQLGNGNQTSQTLPVAVSTLTNVIAIAAGNSHSVALKSDGTVWTWGTAGQIGDGANVMRLTPVQVASLSDVIAVAAGASHSLALKGDGTVWGWGINTSGQIGDGTQTSPRLSPVQTSGLTGVVAIAGGDYHSAAVVGTDLSMRGWGDNGAGQIGDGTGTLRKSPVAVLSLTDVRAIEAGANRTVAALLDGGVKIWGAAVGSTGATSTTPIDAPGNPAGMQVAAGSSHQLSVTFSGVVWAWKSNTDSQLGDGTSVERIAAVSISDAAYAWKVGTPIVTIASGTYFAAQNVGVSSATSGATLRYTSDGSDPTETSVVVPGNGIVVVGQSLVLKAKAWKSGTPASNIEQRTYTLQGPTPTFNPPAGTYTTSQSVSITSSLAGATIRYTVDGSEPTTSSAAYSSAVAITASATLKARVFSAGWTDSAVATASYTLKVPTPTFAPGGGSYAGAQSVSMSNAEAGATIRYTTSGSEPTLGSPVYSAPVSVNGTTTVRAVASKAGWASSETKVATYRISLGTATTPTISPAGGTYEGPTIVRLSTSDSSAVIRFTQDGTEPTARSPQYRWPIMIAATTTVKAKAFLQDYVASATATATYGLDAAGAVATPTLEPAGGRFGTYQVVTVSVPTAGATIHYTTDGAEPTESDPVIASGSTVTVSRSLPLKARAFKSGLDASETRRADFVITGVVAAAAYASFAVKGDGSLWAWGSNVFGRLGDGTTQNRLAPVSIAGVTDVVAVAGGEYHTLAVTRDGSVWAWGYNGLGQLGFGDTTTRYTPTKITTLSGVVGVAAGKSHSLVVKADGTVWAWGTNYYGELGDGTLVPKLAPIQVPGLAGVSQVAAGGGFSLALQDDGAAAGLLWGWGRNHVGQLGEGSTVNRLDPVRTATTAPVAFMAGAAEAVYAADANGRVWAWGDNDYGEMGDGTTGVDRYLPSPVPWLGAAVALAGGPGNGLAVTDDGLLWSWGLSSSGTLGDGGAGSRAYPDLVRTLTTVSRVAFGDSHGVAVRVGGDVWSWGVSGSVGDGTTAARSTPVSTSGLALVDNAWLLNDPDADGLATWLELYNGTDPLLADSNGDGLSDSVASTLTIPAGNPDVDFDGLSNAAEIALGTDPFVPDTDGDGTPDGADAFPLDSSRWEALVPLPGDTTPPVINLTEPTNAISVP